MNSRATKELARLPIPAFFDRPTHQGSYPILPLHVKPSIIKIRAMWAYVRPFGLAWMWVFKDFSRLEFSSTFTTPFLTLFHVQPTELNSSPLESIGERGLNVEQR
jgi:hypothetical protein